MTFLSIAQPPLHRVGGNLALDFANTVSWRGTANETDHIATCEGLVRWAEEGGLLDGAIARPALGEQCLAIALTLRAAIRSVMEAALDGRDAAADRAVLLALLRDALSSARLAGTPAQLCFADPCDRITGGVARAAVDLLRDERIARLKMCPRDDCHWLFLDLSKNGSRRWCAMESCGKRAKIEQHRRRHKGR